MDNADDHVVVVIVVGVVGVIVIVDRNGMVGVKALANVKSNERASVMMDVVLIVMVLITVSDV